MIDLFPPPQTRQRRRARNLTVKRLYTLLLVAGVIVTSWLILAAPSIAAPPDANSPYSSSPYSSSPYSGSRPALTLPTLTQRIEHPIRQGGATVIDLRGFTIDLRQNDAQASEDFSTQFYQQLQKVLNAKKQQGSRYLGIDLSGAVIQGDFQLTQFAQRIPAYGDALLPELEAFKQSFQPNATQPNLAPYPRAYSNRLSRFLLPSVRTNLSDTLALRGPLIINQTCFTGRFNASNVYFLNRVEAQGAIFTQNAQWQAARFAQNALFNESHFQQGSNFRTALFAGATRFRHAQFSNLSEWQGATFHSNTSFARADFQAVNFARAHWQADADFEQAKFRAATNFQKGRFDGALYLTDAALEGPINLRQAQFQQSISLRAAHVVAQIDLGDARFAKRPASGESRSESKSPKSVSIPKPISINVADLDFSAGEARILGSPGQIGKMFSVPTLTSNETVLRNLVRNFRLLEQIEDANQLEYTLEQLRLSQIRRHLLGTSLNQASHQKLVSMGLTPLQATAVTERVAQQPFVSRTDLLSVDEIDLATYLKVRDRITTQSTQVVNRLQNLLRWLILAGLLQLSNYGTNVGLVFSVGITTVTLFALMFWLVDRFRRLTPTPIVPTPEERVAMVVSSVGILTVTLSLLVQSSGQPLATLATIGLLTAPIPGILVVRLYQVGRYHDLMDRSYFVKNGALRRLQILIARLPITPRFPFFRERYAPLLSDRKWNWLNYFDFSLNNWFKFGFNDIRLRDRAVPGLISALVWYQWSLGIVYITLLLWTLSRTIPGLNLLLYF